MSPANHTKRLALVVPYRDRAAHLEQFVPHILRFLDSKGMTFTVHIVEQMGEGPFNRGKLKNVGFVLAEPNADYVCFHDVDYLPLDADYSCNTSGPTRLIWHGLRIEEDYESFFGAVVLFDNNVYRQVNGYSNEFEGWGWEDTELKLRTEFAGYQLEKRDGTYEALPHLHHGILPDGRQTEEATRNQRRYEERAAHPNATEVFAKDGLSSLRFELESNEGPAVRKWNDDRVFHHRAVIDRLDESVSDVASHPPGPQSRLAQR